MGPDLATLRREDTAMSLLDPEDQGLRRLEIPEDMQKKHGFAPLGLPDGPVKRAIFGETSGRLYAYDRRAGLSEDRIALHRDAYEREGPGRTNRRYGFVAGSARA